MLAVSSQQRSMSLTSATSTGPIPVIFQASQGCAAVLGASLGQEFCGACALYGFEVLHVFCFLTGEGGIRIQVQ